MNVIRVVIIVFTLTVAAVAVVTFAGCTEGEASAEGRLEERRAGRAALLAQYAANRQARSEKNKRQREEFDRRLNAPREEVAEQAEVPPPPKRRVRRFIWGSPAETQGKAWNVPEEDSVQSTLTAFLRICIAEADGNPQDCVGIWQSLRNIRRRGCERGHVRRITECDESGETMLSVFRRGQPHIMAVKGYALRNARAAWIRNLETDCEMPGGYLDYLRRQNKSITQESALDRWDAQYGSRRCSYAVELGKALISKRPLVEISRPGHRLEWVPGRPITWGGRCESGKASCDDRVACARGLARITSGPKTHNAFWRRPTNEGEIDPVCKQMGYTKVPSDPPPELPTSAPIAAADPPMLVSDG